MLPEGQTAYRVLQLLAEKSLHSAQLLPESVDEVPQWNGIGFSLLGYQFVVPIGELSEMLEVPPYTKLPSVKSWVKGVANVRGRLLPVYDLAAYLGGALKGTKKQQRLLVLDRENIYSGLWVEQVFGMQYFPIDSRLDGLPDGIPESLVPFTDGYFNVDGKQWMVFHLAKLLEQDQFLDVAG